MDITEANLIDWRALVRRLARGADTTAAELESCEDAANHEHAARWRQDAAELRRLGDWLDSLAGVSMRKPVNGHGRVRG